MAAQREDFRIEQGKTFQRIIRWETNPIVYADITAISIGAPVQITAPSHGIPDGWKAAVIGVVGMDEINAKNGRKPRGADWHRVTVVGPNDVAFNDVSSWDYDPYVSGGSLMYYTPHDLTSYNARMQIKDRVGGTELALLHSDTGEIILDAVNFTISLLVDAAVTAAWTWTRGTYDLELISPGGIVTAILTGNALLTQEITTHA